jgi:hypothetical protein
MSVSSCSHDSCSHRTLETLTIDQRNRINEIMQPGMLSLEGFIGPDDDLEGVYFADKDTLKTLGVTHFQIGSELANLAEKVILSKSNCIETGKFVVTFEENLEHDPKTCPFQEGDESCHIGRKLFTARKITTNQVLHFSELAIGLIRDHAYFQTGRYRVDPILACDILDLQSI